MKLNKQLLSLAFVLCMTLVGAEDVEGNRNSSELLFKNNEKTIYPKKVSNIKKKPNKLVTLHQQATNTEVKLNKNGYKKKAITITDKFKDLPADDFEFIKELDKQFNLHGGKIKIQINNDNSTNGKNLKRTIDHELGYGYNPNGYDYTPPKYEFYPYSQHDIPPAQPQQQDNAYFLPSKHQHPVKPQHHLQHVRTEVTIEPSYSYELKTHDYYEATDRPQVDLPAVDLRQHSQGQGHGQGYEEPVIVLRIPGPTKYAAHLQALLQKYLEIRAAQYLQILEANELRHQQQHEQYYQQQQQQQQHQPQPQYEEPTEPQVEQEHTKYYPQQQQQVEEEEPVAQKQYYIPSTPTGAEAYAQQEVQTTATQHEPEHEHAHAAEEQIQTQPQTQAQPQHYEYYNEDAANMYVAPIVHNKEQAVQYYYSPAKENAHGHSPYVYLVHMPVQQKQQHVEYETQPRQQMQPIYVADEQQQQQHHHSLPITENNPRPTHTKIIYKSQENPHNYVRPYENYAEISNNGYSMYTHHITPEVAAPAPAAVAHYAAESEADTYNSDSEVVITQRPYHYQPTKRSHKRGRRRPISGVNSVKVSTTMRTTLVDAEEHLQNIRNYVREKFGAQPSKSIEIPTKTVQK